MARNDSPGETETSESDEPSIADRVEASDDFRAALEQSSGLVVQYRRIFFVLVLVSILVAAGIFVSRYLL